jgi:hypothetical protein
MSPLVSRNEHLALHRGMILSRSLLAGIAGLAPIPLLDEWLAAVTKRGTIRRIAEARGVDLDEDAVRAVAEGRVPAPSWRHLLTSTAVTGLLTRTLRRVLLAYAIAKRAEDTRRSFAVATLFDHYCARLHVGAGLDGDKARALRAAIDEAVSLAPAGIAERVFKRGLVAGGRSVIRAPFRLLDGLAGGLISRALQKGDEARAEEVVEEALAETRGGNVFARAIRTVDHELTNAGAGWLGDLVTGFEAAWRRRAHERA